MVDCSQPPVFLWLLCGHCISRLFHSPLAQPWQQHVCLPLWLRKGAVTGVWKNGGNSHRSCERIMQCGTRQSQSLFRPANHKSMMPANWRPCLIPHWQSYCHQARTVSQSIGSANCVVSRERPKPCMLTWIVSNHWNAQVVHVHPILV